MEERAITRGVRCWICLTWDAFKVFKTVATDCERLVVVPFVGVAFTWVEFALVGGRDCFPAAIWDEVVTGLVWVVVGNTIWEGLDDVAVATVATEVFVIGRFLLWFTILLLVELEDVVELFFWVTVLEGMEVEMLLLLTRIGCLGASLLFLK